MNYQYWIVRFVPNVARGEFTNIGIVSGRDGGDWSVAFERRAVRNTGDLTSDLRELSAWMTWFSRTIARHATPSIDGSQTVSAWWIEHLRGRQSNAIQFSEAAPIDAGSSQEAINLLFPHLVEREVSHRRRSMNRSVIRQSVRDIYLYEDGYALNRDLFVQPRATIGKQHGTFDILRDSTRSRKLTNVWAFNVQRLEGLERDIQSWNFLVGRLRSAGAELATSRGRSLEIAHDAPIDVVFDPPTREDQASYRHDIFEAAQEAWTLNGVAAQSLAEFEGEGRARQLAPA